MIQDVWRPGAIVAAMVVGLLLLLGGGLIFLTGIELVNEREVRTVPGTRVGQSSTVIVQPGLLTGSLAIIGGIIAIVCSVVLLLRAARESRLRGML